MGGGGSASGLTDLNAKTDYLYMKLTLRRGAMALDSGNLFC